MEMRKLIPRKIVGKTYIIYDARAITISLADALMIFTTQNQQEAIKHASNHGTTVYSYEVCEDGALINTIFIYHLAKFMGK